MTAEPNALELTPLETLPAAVERAAGAATPAPVKLMTARGMAPLPPAELAVALYQLTFESDEALREAAYKSAAELPDPVLKGALSAALDVRVLDFYARRVTQRAALLEVVLLNKATHDETFRHLAKILGERDLEMIAKNEERLLRSPAIIAALYMNPKTRMSTAQRAVELAVRNGVRVEGIPAFDEAAKAIAQSAGVSADADDVAFREAAVIAVDESAQLLIVALDPAEQAKVDEEALVAAEAEAALEATAETPLEAHSAESEEKKKKLSELSPSAKVRVATLGNAFARSVLIREKNMTVAMACIRSPGVSPSEALKYAQDRSLDEDIIRFVSNHRQWTRLPGIRMALCNNPKTPMATTLRLLPTLPVRDLKNIARSKGIPSAIAKAAKQLVSARGA
jgi:hypothetical protein